LCYREEAPVGIGIGLKMLWIKTKKQNGHVAKIGA